MAKVWLSTRSLQCCAPRSRGAMHPALGCAAHPISPGCTPYPCCAPQGAEHPSGGMPRRTGCVPPGFGARKRAQGTARHLWARFDHGAGPLEHRGVTWAPYLPFQHLPAVSPDGPPAGGGPHCPAGRVGAVGQDARAGRRGKAVVGTAPAAGSPIRTRGAAGGRGGARRLLGLCLCGCRRLPSILCPFFAVEVEAAGVGDVPVTRPAACAPRLVNHLPAKLAINSCPCSLAAPWPGWHVVITGPPPPGCPSGHRHHRGGFAGLGTPPRGPPGSALCRGFPWAAADSAVCGEAARRAVVTVRGTRLSWPRARAQ